MKHCRIYGIANGIPFHKFPNGDNVMDRIRVDVYKKKRILSTFASSFKKLHHSTWSFQVGDIECILFQKKPFKFKVFDDENKLFDNNQVASVYFLQQFVMDEHVRVDDERVRLGSHSLPFREQDTHLETLLSHPTFKSPRTGLSARNRTIIQTLTSEEFAFKAYEIKARNELFVSHYNSWLNRFGKEKIKGYVQSDDFFLKLFEATDLYFFGNVLKRLASWKFAFNRIRMEGEHNTTMIAVRVSKSNAAKLENIYQIIEHFHKDITRIIVRVLGASSNLNKEDTIKRIASNVFGIRYEPCNLLRHRAKDVPRIEYDMLYSKDAPKLVIF